MLVKRFTAIIALALLVTALGSLPSCKVGPKYERPAAIRDSLFRFAQGADTNTLANLEWVSLFKDTTLHRLIRTGLKNNYDIRTAFARIEEALANFKAERGKQFPTIGLSGNGGWLGEQIPNNGGSREYSVLNASAGLSWEIDLWGKMRRSKEAARAYLFSQEAYQQAVRITLINEIVSSYFDLLEYDNEMRITQDNIRLREESLELVKAKMIAGTASGLVVAQAEAELALARSKVPGLEILTGMKENYISTLIGEPLRAVNRGRPMLDQLTPPAVVSAGVPSQLLFRRPDIMMAEQQLVAANANIGVARAMMFPSLSISGSIGAGFNPVTMIYSAVGNLVAPVFAGGQLRANVKKTQAQKEQMLYSYLSTVDNSIMEVSNALLKVDKMRNLVSSTQATVEAAQTAYDLSDQLYNAGYASYLDVINAQSLLFDSQISLSQAQSDELTAMVELYTALGGGWR